MALAKRLPVAMVTRDVAFNQDIKAIEPHRHVVSKYVLYALLAFEQRILALTDEAAHGTKRLDTDLLRAFRIPLPARPEQQRIVDFLDTEVGRIDELVHMRSRQRDLVTERLSKVLDSAFEAKPGRVSLRLKHLLRADPCYGVLVPRFAADGTPFVRVGDLSGLSERAADLIRIERSQSDEYCRTVVAPGDVLVSVVGSVDKCAVVPDELAGANVARAVARLQPIDRIPPDVLKAWLSTPSYLRQAAFATGSDTAQPTLNMGDLANFWLSVPDSRAGIEHLAQEVRAAQSAARAAVRVIDRQIALLRERRQAVIAAAVTGRLQVPKASMANAAA